MRKNKLSVDEQINHLKDKGIKFELITEDQAKSFLCNNNYYFKIKSYAKNYEKYQSTDKAGQYLHLDFAYLKELSTIDMHIRKFVINLSLSIEHFLKTKLIRDFSNNSIEDGYQIIEEFLAANPNIMNSIKQKEQNSACSNLIRRYNGDFAIWNIIEILSFGDFIKLYNLYYDRYPSESKMKDYLWSVKFLRNAAAHNNCLINSLKVGYVKDINPNKSINTFISKIPGITTDSRKKRMRNHVIHDFVVSLYVFDKVVTSNEYKKNTYEELITLFDNRLIRNRNYFESNDTIKLSYQFVRIIIDYFYKECV